jgi:hypothetical protein
MARENRFLLFAESAAYGGITHVSTVACATSTQCLGHHLNGVPTGQSVRDPPPNTQSDDIAIAGPLRKVSSTDSTKVVGEHPLRSRAKTARTTRASPEMRITLRRFIAIQRSKPNDNRASAASVPRNKRRVPPRVRFFASANLHDRTAWRVVRASTGVKYHSCGGDWRLSTDI